jgi:hypothetical protein
MIKKILFLVLFIFTCTQAKEISQLSDFDQFLFEDAFERKVYVPADTQKVLISFDKKSNDIASTYLNNQGKGFLEKNKMIYIGDIHKMPSFVTAMFARPKMQKYNFTIYLYNDKNLDKVIPYKEEHLTLLVFDENHKLINITFHSDLEDIF